MDDGQHDHRASEAPHLAQHKKCATRHDRWMAENSANEAIRSTDGRSVRVRLAESSKEAREEIERMLATTLSDHNMVRQVTTAIIRVA
jgi:hypothetical protein